MRKFKLFKSNSRLRLDLYGNFKDRSKNSKRVKWVDYNQFLKKKSLRIIELPLLHRRQRTFNYVFLIRKYIKLFYGGLKNSTFYRYWSLNKKFPNRLFIQLESRLDIFLVRLGFFTSIFESQQSILHGRVFLNGCCIKHKGFVLKKGDMVCVQNIFYIDFLENRKKGFKVVGFKVKNELITYSPLVWGLKDLNIYIDSDTQRVFGIFGGSKQISENVSLFLLRKQMLLLSSLYRR